MPKTTKTPQTTTSVICPACSCKRSRFTETAGVFVCTRCHCLHGTCYLGESYALVRPYLKAGDLDVCKPFDLTTLGSKGIGRRHGFYDPADRLVVQIG